MTQDILVVVHPGSACGSADFNIGFLPASKGRADLVRELDAWAGPVVVIDGELSDELAGYSALDNALRGALARSKVAGVMSLRLQGDDPEQNDRIREVIEGMAPAQRCEAVFHVTGAWYYSDDASGCVGGVVDTIRELGGQAFVCDSAVRGDAQDDPNALPASKSIQP